MFIICDVDDVIQDIASHSENLARGLPYLGQGGHLYEDVELTESAMVGDHFDGVTHIPDSPQRAENEAYQQETTRLAQVLETLTSIRDTLEADVGPLTLAELEAWPNAIGHVASASTPAEFMQRWERYEKKRTLMTVETIRFIRRFLTTE